MVSYDEAVAKIRAAVDARAESGRDILIMARTDARGCHEGGMEEAIRRCQAFMEAGADISFLEAPLTVEEMKRYSMSVPGYKMANMLAGGKTPRLSREELQAMGFHIAAYPFDLILGAIGGMRAALDGIKGGAPDPQNTDLLWELSGFNQYRAEEKLYQPKLSEST